MAKTKQQKQSMVDELKKTLLSMKGAVLVVLNKLPVADDWALRKKLRTAGVSYRVIKKTLFYKAVKELNLPGLDLEPVRGTIGMLASNEDEVVSAKLLAEFAKGKETVGVIGGYMNVNGTLDLLDASRVKALAMLPGKRELFGSLVSTIRNPITRLHGTLINPLGGLVNVLEGIARSKT